MAHPEALPSGSARRHPLLWLGLAASLVFFFGLTHYTNVHENSDLNRKLVSVDGDVFPDHVTRLSSAADPWPALIKRDEYVCSVEKPCKNGACCGSYFGGTTGTCGYGATFCGADCTSNCNATAECGRDAVPAGKTCPLNVCCSQWGFCGSTHEFCAPELKCQNNCVEHPSPPAGGNTGSVKNRVIGYYEAWAARRACYSFPPSAIPVQGLTHVNFAFAYIEPGSFKITTMDAATPESLFTQAADIRTLKSGSENLEVWVSIGGWTFSDNETVTQPVWSDIASSEPNRKKFADNLVSFMKQYGFDGVDLDWEYPGAGDRGGKPHDVENFVKMLKTMRETFNDAGGYGITFTIPSSYWYLRWFDLPGLLEYADWVNLMSYDIHGVWDGSNPIGNRVLAHTNLTEIQLAAELLWRVQVPPSKVVLGVGFYGRSFQLEDASCGTPGCAFKGPAEAGLCTKNPGTLAYFEIMDILDKQKPKPVHDKEAAVKYIQFGGANDQWISYDDEETLKQKVDWADKNGLGGLMVWSIDQDDTNFSALKGLTGQDLPTFASILSKQKAASASWASQNGQSCKMTDCMKDDKVGSWGAAWAIVPGGEKFKDNCGKNENKYVICPVNQMPSACQWRGGESGCGCHGQCHAGEVTLFHSKHGSRNCCKPGQQAFCCESNTWSNLVEGCYFAKDYNCPADKYIASWRNVMEYFDSPSIQPEFKYVRQAYCCPADFNSCHWIGKGSCDDNECADWEIEMLTDTLGDGTTPCVPAFVKRSKVLCCKPPTNLHPFLPVPLENLFPTLPPTTSVPNFDLQQIAHAETPTGTDSSPQAFGWVVIDGPQDAVTSLTKRDGTHLEFLNCEPGTPKHAVNTTYTLQYICMDDSAESNCDAVHQGGAEGTIIKLPEGCGYATYGVVHDIRPAADNVTISRDLLKRAPANPVVHEMRFSYDFSRVKRGTSEVYIRTDYAWDHEYWTDIVAASPMTKRSHKREGDTTVGKRFWSAKESVWRNLINRVRTSAVTGPMGTYRPELLSKSFDRLIYQQDSSSKCGGKSGFLSAKLTGTVSNRLRWGFTMVGTISPTLAFEEAYGFFDSDLYLSGALRFQGSGELAIAGSTKTADLFLSDLSDYAFSHPGIVSFTPKMNIGVSLVGAGQIDGNFSVSFLGGSSSTMRVHAPPSLGSMSGDLRGESVNNAWSGNVQALRTSATGPDGTVFGANMNLRSWMDIKVYSLGSTVAAGKAEFVAQTSHYVRVSTDGNTINVTEGARQASVEAYSASISKAWDQDQSSHNVGREFHAHVVSSAGSPGEDPPGGGSSGGSSNSPPNWSGSAVLRGEYMTCGNTRQDRIECLHPTNLSKLLPGIDIDPANGERYDRRRRSLPTSLAPLLDPRGTGGRRKYTVRGPNGLTFEIWSHTYPNGLNGRFLHNLNSNAGYWTVSNPGDCSDFTMTDDGDPDDGTEFVTEHTVELSYLAQLLTFMLTGEIQMPDGTVYSAYSASPIDPTLLGSGSWFQTPWAQWDPAGQHPDGSISPLDEAFRIMGDLINFTGFVNAESFMNAIKMRLWNGMMPVSGDSWAENQWDDTSADRGPARFEEAMTALRTVVSVFDYLNADGVNEHMCSIINQLHDFFARFDEAVHRASGQTITTQTVNFHDEFFPYVIVPRIEGVEPWVYNRLDHLRGLWVDRRTQLLAGPGPAPQNELNTISGILAEIEDFRERAEDAMIIDTSGMLHGAPPPPP